MTTPPIDEKLHLTTLLERLSETEKETYEIIKQSGGMAIRDLPHKNQGAVGKLIPLGLVEKYREGAQVTKHGFTSMKRVWFVRVKK